MFYSTTSPDLMQSFSLRFRFICPNWFICARIKDISRFVGINCGLPYFFVWASVPGYPRLKKASPSGRSNEVFIKLCITQKFFARFFTKKRVKNFRADIFRLFRTTNRCFARKYRQEPCISRPFRRARGNLRLRSLAYLYAYTPAFCRQEFLADL